MNASAALLRVDDLSIDYDTPDGTRHRALDGATLTLRDAQVLGVVGESGCGKTTLALAIGRLLADTARRASGDLHVNGTSVFELDAAGLRELRRGTLGFVFQNPMSALDPTMRVGRQLALSSGTRQDVGPLLARVGLQDIDRVARSFPHQLSGGMAQRVMIATAIARSPRLIVADEPTASLDAGLRDQILSLLVSQRDLTGAGIVLVGHELHAIGRYSDTVAVMYAGRVVEHGTASAVFGEPAHPYTGALLAVAPGHERQGESLRAIPGAPPVLSARVEACAFSPRCAFAVPQCNQVRPQPREVAGRWVVCHRAEFVLHEGRAQ
jgi:oligopeptide/dipeptide ABC transporter ATP-binding protein